MKIEELLEVLKKWIRLNAIEGITLDIEDMIDFGGVLAAENEALELLVNALEEYKALKEKQIPKEPINKFDQLKFQTGYCPRCSTSVCGINHYCTVCGQALKWSD